MPLSEDLKKMSDAEVAAMSKDLSKKVVKHLALMMFFKWSVIIGVGYAARRALRNAEKKTWTPN